MSDEVGRADSGEGRVRYLQEVDDKTVRLGHWSAPGLVLSARHHRILSGTPGCLVQPDRTVSCTFGLRASTQ